MKWNNSDTFDDRFWKKVFKTNSCWLWTGAVNKNGHGQFRFHGVQKNAHRMLWEHIHGPLSKSVCVCHSCNVPHCVNPSHLYLDSAIGNNRYRTNLGRSRNGSTGKLNRIFEIIRTKRPSTVERFWSFVDKFDHPKGCWLWTGSTNPAGYGVFSNESRIMVMAHRISWEISNKQPIPNQLKVLHQCDVRNCVRPDHLFIGTQHQNVLDMESKGRGRHLGGENNGRSKLTDGKRKTHQGIVSIPKAWPRMQSLSY